MSTTSSAEVSVSASECVGLEMATTSSVETQITGEEFCIHGAITPETVMESLTSFSRNTAAEKDDDGSTSPVRSFMMFSEVSDAFRMTPTSGSSSAVMSSYPASYSMAATRTRNRWIARRKLKGPSSAVEQLSERNSAFSYHTGLTWLDFVRRQGDLRMCRAVTMNDRDRVCALLAEGVSPNCYDLHRRTPLHLAVSRGYTEMVELLLENGANPNLLDAIDNTPLHLAACSNNVEIVLLLLNGGTDINSVDLRGRSPLQLAQSKLKILQHTKDAEIKTKVMRIIQLLMKFLKNKRRDGQELSAEANLLEGFQNRLEISQTAEQVNTEVDNLSKVLSGMDLKC